MGFGTAPSFQVATHASTNSIELGSPSVTKSPRPTPREMVSSPQRTAIRFGSISPSRSTALPNEKRPRFGRLSETWNPGSVYNVIASSRPQARWCCGPCCVTTWSKNTPDVETVHRFRGLLDHLATLTKHTIQPRGDLPAFDRLALPTELQRRAFDLLEVSIPT